MAERPPVLGVDPAVNGAAVLLHPGGKRVLAAWVWTERSRGGCKVSEVVSVHDREGGYRVATRRSVAPFGVVGEVIREEARSILGGVAYALAGENAIVGRAMDTSIVTARNAGRVLGPLEALAVGQSTEWVRATEWRSVILNLNPHTPREEAKAQAMKWMPIRIPSLVEVARLLGGPDDLYDASGVASWLDTHLSSPPSSEGSRRPGARTRKPSAKTPKKSSGRG
jgi:hypothetical protein